MDEITPLSLDQLRSLQRHWENPDLTEEAIAKIAEYGMASMPFEACGVVLPTGLVVQLENHADDPRKEYKLSIPELKKFMDGWLEVAEVPAGVVDVGFIVWHTHPSGFVGPSDEDIRSARALRDSGYDIPQVVVSLPAGTATRF